MKILNMTNKWKICCYDKKKINTFTAAAREYKMREKKAPQILQQTKDEQLLTMQWKKKKKKNYLYLTYNNKNSCNESTIGPMQLE